MYVYIYICSHIHISIYIYLILCMYMYIYIYIYIHLIIYIYITANVIIYIYIILFKNIYIYIMYTHKKPRGCHQIVTTSGPRRCPLDAAAVHAALTSTGLVQASRPWQVRFGSVLHREEALGFTPERMLNIHTVSQEISFALFSSH